jgi:DMSO reductase anchor subunit
MHPAFSVIAFTTLSGAGYGLLFWLGLLVAAGQAGRAPLLVLVTLAVSTVLVSAGLLASTAHLGRPERAWRAFSQWRSSWLSREGVAAVATYVPMLGLAAAVWFDAPVPWRTALALTASAMAVVCVLCTARIYDSLKPIPAWRTGWVLAGYLALAAASGAVLLWAIGVLGFALPAHRGDGLLLVVLLLVAGAFKLGYWRHVDRLPLPVSAASALALDAGSTVTAFEAPHTEANFLQREMGYALARKHGRRLRRLALLLLVLVPTVLLAAALVRPQLRPLAAGLVPACVLAGILVERWLFFAQARHVMITYYRPA